MIILLQKKTWTGTKGRKQSEKIQGWKASTWIQAQVKITCCFSSLSSCCISAHIHMGYEDGENSRNKCSEINSTTFDKILYQILSSVLSKNQYVFMCKIYKKCFDFTLFSPIIMILCIAIFITIYLLFLYQVSTMPPCMYKVLGYVAFMLK